MTSLVPTPGPTRLPESKTEGSTAALEEYKLVDQQARFVMTAYMQGLALYLALIGFGIRELLQSSVDLRTLVMICALTCGNALAYYAATHFRRMAYHALDRQTELAAQLSFQKPYAMIWGYYVGICSFGVVQSAITALALKILFWKS